MISDDLKDLNIISRPTICAVFDDIYADILDYKHLSPSEFIRTMWARYHIEYIEQKRSNNNLNGYVFEGLIAMCLYNQNIRPLYTQVNFSFVPNIDFDFVVYSKEYGPIILSAKTSLRERQKQAALEGLMLRQVHREAKSYLITNDEKEAENCNRKIKKRDILGLDAAILSTDRTFDQLIIDLQNLTLYSPGKIDILKSRHVIK